MSDEKPGADAAGAADLDGSREAILKAHVVGEANRLIPASQAISTEDERFFISVGALPPPYDPYTLAMLLEHSDALRQNIDAYVTNIDAFGHRYEPVLDLNAPDLRDRVRQAMEHGLPTDNASATDAEVDAKIKEVAATMRDEKATLESFFESCCLDSSFVSLRRKTRQDLELIGNAYWEVLRNAGGEIVQFVYVPAFTIRLMPLDREPTLIKHKIRQTEVRFQEVEARRRFRRYVQLFEMRMVYFKEFGDPRILSSKTGRYYDTVEALNAVDPGDRPASELIQFRIHCAKSPYGVPRWIGNLLAVLGSRQAEEVNYLYFDNKSVPPLAILVSGGRVSEDTVNRLKDFVETEIKGKRNFHKMLLLDAEAAGGAEGNTGRMKIQIQPLTGAQHNDALFQNYVANNMDKIGMAFRLPRMLRGDIRDFNRATADAALSFAETQVFSPEREEFDFFINRHILPALGVRYWRFRSNAPALRDPVGLAPIITALVNANVLTGSEARSLAEGVFNREFLRITEGWAQKPPSVYLQELAAGMQAPEDRMPPEPVDDTPAGFPEEKPSVSLRAKQYGGVGEVGSAGGEGTPSGGIMGTGDLGSGGMLVPAQGGPPRRKIPRSIAKVATELVQLRDAIRDAEEREAEAAFRVERRAAEAGKKTP